MNTTKAYAARKPKDTVRPICIERRTVGNSDVLLDIDYCGVCHTDLHFVNNDWGITRYPLVPGHEIVGKIKAIGSSVSKFEVGQLAAVGCMVNSCGECPSCKKNLEQYCQNGFVGTYNHPTDDPGGLTFGGYSKRIVVDERFVLSVPNHLNVEGTPPLLCAGITTYSPLKHWNIGPDMKVGIIGLGGLGHMGFKFSKALGAHTVMITASQNKVGDAKILGADDVLLSANPESMSKNLGQFDFLLNTIPVKHSLDQYLNLLKIDGVMCIVGAPGMFNLNAGQLVFGRKTLAGSLIGGIKQTQEMLDFCGTHNIVSDIEIIRMNQINQAYARLLNSDVKYRFVIDMSSMN